MTLRVLILLAALACVSCSDAGAAPARPARPPETPMNNPNANRFADIAPWHMWGSSQTLTIVNNGGTRLQSQDVQLAKINYKRPETWRFFFAARIVGADAAVPGPVALDIAVFYSVTLGVGRDVWRSPTMADFLAIQQFFVEFRYIVPVGVVPGFSNYNWKYTDKGVTPPLDDSNPLTSVHEIDTIVSEDIQCQASVVILQPNHMAPGSTMQVEVAAFFAPNVHVRPDWMGDDPERAFMGNETGGT